MAQKIDGVDGLLLSLGGYSKYQLVQYSIMMLCNFSSAFQLLDMIFIGKMVPYQCALPTNETDFMIDGDVIPRDSNVSYHKCHIDVPYSRNGTSYIHTLSCIYGMQYSERRDASYVSEFDLVCDRAALSDLPQTLLILGQAFGALTLPYFSDRFGRKPIHVVSHTVMLVIGIGIAYSPNYLVFSILRLLMGGFQQGIVLTSHTYNSELFPTQHRGFMNGLVSGVLWTVIQVVMAAIAYLLKYESWRYLQMVYTAASLLVIVQILFQDESLRWLIVNGKYEIAIKIIKRAIRQCKVDEEIVMAAFSKAVAQNQNTITPSGKTVELLLSEKASQIHEEKIRFLDMLKRKVMARTTIIIWYMWCTAALCYFGLFFTSTSLSGNMYLNVFLNSVTGIPVAILFWYIIDRLGRKKTAILFYLLGGIGLIIATIISTTTSSSANSMAILVLNLVGKVGASGAFGVCFYYTVEIFPTNLRNIGLGSASVAARTGGMVAPFSRLLLQYIPWGPGAIFGIFSMVAAILVTFLPETSGKQLPQTMADLKLIYKHQSKKKLLQDQQNTDKNHS